MMIDTSQEELDANLVSFFHRHSVPVYFSFQRQTDMQRVVITSFVLSISEQWFLITAGHCIRQIQEILDSGYQIKQCLLMDSFGMGAQYLQPIPFVYEASSPTCLSDDNAFDYGVMVLSTYYKELLLKNNVRALNENVWKKQPNQVDFYLLLGVPAELVKVKSEAIEITPSLHYITPVDEKPEAFSDVDAPLFYGKIGLGNELKSIEGMSGGPVFGFQHSPNGELRYWLTALQSRWLPRSHFIAARPTKLLGDFLETEFLGNRK